MSAEGGRSPVGANSVSISRGNVNHMLIASGDYYVRLFDRRYLPHPSLSPRPSTRPHCLRYCPTHLVSPTAPEDHATHRSVFHATHAEFAADGRSFVASYLNCGVFVFDVYGPEGCDPTAWMRPPQAATATGGSTADGERAV